MPAPTPLAIATASLQRLVKEHASYEKELQQQQRRVERLETSTEGEAEDERGNQAFQMQQERKAIDETKAVFPGLQDRIASATEKLQSLLESRQGGDEAEVAKAEKAIAEAKSSES